MRWLLVALAAASFSAHALAQPHIVSPGADAVVHTGNGVVRVVVSDVPADARLQPLLDGAAASAPVAPPRFDLHGVARGEHQLVVTIVAADGRDLGRIGPVKFTVWQGSRLNRGRRR